jgi:hypothetical protein
MLDINSQIFFSCHHADPDEAVGAITQCNLQGFAGQQRGSAHYHNI